MTRTGTRAALQLGRDFEAGERGHFNVGDEDVGPRLLHRAQSFVAVARARDDLDVIFHFEQRGERAQHHGLVFGDDDPDFVALGGRHALSFAERRRLAARGK